MLHTRDKLVASQRSFFELWQSLKSSDTLPLKGDFGPKNLRGLSANFAMLCVNEQSELYIAFSGTALDDVWGRNITGETIDDTTQKVRRLPVKAFFDGILNHPCGGYVSETFTKESGAEVRTNTLYLPVKADRGCKAIVSIWDIVGPGYRQHARLPRRSEIDDRELHFANFLDVGYGVPKMVQKTARPNIDMAQAAHNF